MFSINNAKKDLNLSKNLTKQMVHYMLMKMTSQIVSYFTCKKITLVTMMISN